VVHVLTVQIRKARASDTEAIAAIILPTIREGATYALDPDLSEADALAYWMGPDKETFVAEEDGVILGTYYIRPNRPGIFTLTLTHRPKKKPGRRAFWSTLACRRDLYLDDQRRNSREECP